MDSTQRALELQQLAAGSTSPLDSSQLSAAAQRCSEEAQTAAQMAFLARAEAERLSGDGPGPVLGLSGNSPAPAVPEVVSTAAAVDDGSTDVDSTAGTPSVSTAMNADSAVMAEAKSAAASSDTDLTTQAEVVSGLSGLSHDSAELIHSLSSEMQAAMHQLVASISLSTPTSQESWHEVLHISVSQQVPGSESLRMSAPAMFNTTLGTSSSQQTPVLPSQPPWQIPGISPSSFLGSAQSPGTSAMPDQAPGGEVHSPRDEGPSGMQLHLMHQLEGLERSVRRVEQQVSSTKETRRRLKTASLPAQVLVPFANVAALGSLENSHIAHRACVCLPPWLLPSSH